MLTRIRDILAQEYIGAIIIGMLAAQGVLAVISWLPEPLYVYLQNRSRNLDTPSVQGLSELMGFREFEWWPWAVRFLVIGLYFLVAYALLVWIYMRDQAVAHAGEESEEP